MVVTYFWPIITLEHDTLCRRCKRTLDEHGDDLECPQPKENPKMVNQHNVLQTIAELAAQGGKDSETKRGKVLQAIAKTAQEGLTILDEPEGSVPINTARDRVDAMVQAGKFGEASAVDKVTPGKKYLDAVQLMQQRLGVYNGEIDEGPGKDALGREIEQGLIDLGSLWAQAPNKEAKQAYADYIAAARREYAKPTPHVPGSPITIGDTDPQTDIDPNSVTFGR